MDDHAHMRIWKCAIWITILLNIIELQTNIEYYYIILLLNISCACYILFIHKVIRFRQSEVSIKNFDSFQSSKNKKAEKFCKLFSCSSLQLAKLCIEQIWSKVNGSSYGRLVRETRYPLHAPPVCKFNRYIAFTKISKSCPSESKIVRFLLHILLFEGLHFVTIKE